MSQTALESANELISLNTRVLNKAIERQVELGDVFAGGSKQQVNVLKLTEDPKELVEKQTKLADQYAVIYTEAAKTNMAMAIRTSEEYKLWFENSAKSVNKIVQHSAPNLMAV